MLTLLASRTHVRYCREPLWVSTIPTCRGANSSDCCRASAARMVGHREAHRGMRAAMVRHGVVSVSPISRREHRDRSGTRVPYAELHCHSNFSFLDGASHPEQLAEEAARLGLEALALTDHDGFYGVVRFAEAARTVGLPTVFGAEISLTAAWSGGAWRKRHAASSRYRDGRRQSCPRSARSTPARACRWACRLRAACACAQPWSSRWREGCAAIRVRRCRRRGCWSCLGAHRLPERRGAGGVGERRAARGDARVATDDLGLRSRPRAGRAVGSRQPARFGAQRRARRVGGAQRHRLRRDQQRALRHACTTSLGHRGRSSASRAAASTNSTRGCRRRRARICAAVRNRQRRFMRYPGVVDLAAEIGRAAAFDLSLVAPNLPPFPCPRDANGVQLTEMAYLRQIATRGWPATIRRTSGTTRRPVAARTRVAHHRSRTRCHRRSRLRWLLPGRVGSRRVLQSSRHLLPGPGKRRQQRGLLRAGCHQGRCRQPRVVVRTFPVTRTRWPTRHRYRHRIRPPRRSHPVRVPALRPAPHRAGRQRHYLSRSFIGTRHGQGVGLRAGPARCVEQADGCVGHGRHNRRSTRSRDPVSGAGTGGRDRRLAAPPRHSLRRHGDLRSTGDRGVPGRVGSHAGSQRVAVGQRRLRGGRVGEVRSARSRHAQRVALRGRPDPRAPRLRRRPGDYPARRRCVRNACVAPTRLACSRSSRVRRWRRCHG